MAMLDLRPSAFTTPVVLPMNRRSTSQALDQPVLSQVVLGSSEAMLLERSALSALPADYLAAMQQLVKRIAQLRSSGAFGEEGIEPSPALLTAVTAEAQAVLDQSSAVLAQPSAAIPGSPPSLPGLQSLQHLIPHLLWGVAQSTHEVMQLLEGVMAQVQYSGRWQTGVLRLLVMLQFSSATQTAAFDLVTQQPPVLLPPDHPLSIPHSLLSQPSITAATLLQRLTAQIDRSQPALRSFLTGFTANWLMPGQSWQTGEVALSLGFAFTPVADPGERDDDASAFLPPTLKFAQSAWIEQHIAVAVEHQLTQILQQQVRPSEETVHLLQGNSALTAQQAGQLAVVIRGCHAIDELQCSMTLASRTFAQQSLKLDELALRLLWNINRTAYEVMQWLSGISVRLLQPGGCWSTGRLRFVVLLHVQTPEQAWQFDLACRAPGLISSELQDSATIVQSESCAWCVQPVRLDALTDRIWQTIEQNAPEVALLRTATEATVSTEVVLGQLGAVRLSAMFEYCEESLATKPSG
jgi:hypothetical protein